MKIISYLPYLYILPSPIPNPVIKITLMPLTLMLHRQKELRNNLIKNMKLNSGRNVPEI